MPRHHDHRLLPYAPEALYAIVADVGRYPEFLPWVLKADIVEKTERGFLADLTVGYKLFQETYRSEVILTPCERIDIRYIKGPFKHLHNHWVFSAAPSNSANLSFFIDFEFQSTFFQGLIQTVFTDAVTKIVSAFEERAKVMSFEKSI
jgi:coenzyme Q-binding protein COQ10